MKRIIYSLQRMVLGALLALFCVSSFGQTGTIPTIDGDGTDAAWDQAATWPIEAIIDVSTVDDAADCSGDVAVLWSADSLYVRVNVADEKLYFGADPAYNYDNVCIYFDVFNKSTNSYVDSTQMYYEKHWWGDPTAMSGRYGADWMAPPYGNFAVDTSSGTGYTIELAVGWDEFDRVPAVGDKLGFDVKISDNDGIDGGEGRDQLAWRDKTDGGWDNPLLWGEIMLNADGSVEGMTDFVPTTDGMGENDRGWAFTSAWDVATVIDESTIDNAADASGNVAVLWSADSLYVRVNVADEKLYFGADPAYNYDNVCIYFDVFNKSTNSYVDSTQMYYEKHWWGDPTAMSGRYGADWMAPPYGNFAVDTSSGTGYTIELAVGWDEFDRVPAVGDKLGFDVKISDNDGIDGGEGRDQLAWRDNSDGGWDNPLLWGEITLGEDGMVTGQTDFDVTIDGMGENDRGWAFAPTFICDTVISDDFQTHANDLSATFKATWNTDQIVVMVNVVDDTLYTFGTEELYNFDNVFIAFDLLNKKTGSYTDTTQFYYERHWWETNLTAIGARHGSNWTTPPLDTFATVVNEGTGYTIEIALDWADFVPDAPAVGDFIGLDVKLSDNDGLGRDQISWNDQTDGGWDNPSLFGTMELLEDGNFAAYFGPEAPTSLVATVDGADVTLTWDAVEGVAGYNVYRDAELIGDGITDLTLIDADLADGTYVYSLTTVDAGGMESDAVTASVDVTTIGIDNSFAQNTQVYPNPATDNLFIRSSEVIESISLMTITGQVVNKIDVHAEFGSLDIGELKSGVYIVSVFSNESVANYRVLVK